MCLNPTPRTDRILEAAIRLASQKVTGDLEKAEGGGLTFRPYTPRRAAAVTPRRAGLPTPPQAQAAGSAQPIVHGRCVGEEEIVCVTAPTSCTNVRPAPEVSRADMEALQALLRGL